MSASRPTRRGFLAASAAFGLSTLLVPRSSRGATGTRRLVVFHLPNGLRAERWVPGNTGPLTSLPSGIAALEPFRDRLLVVSGLRNPTAMGPQVRDVPGASAASLLTGAAANDSGASAASIDQRLATATGKRALVTGVGEGAIASTCGVSVRGPCLHRDTLSWTGAARPALRETRVEWARARLASESALASFTRRRGRLLSNLRSHVATGRFADELGEFSQQLTGAINDLEGRDPDWIPRVDGEGEATHTYVPADPRAAIAAHTDLIVEALAADTTRSVVFMLGPVGWEAMFDFAGATTGYASLADPPSEGPIPPGAPSTERLTQLARVDAWAIEVFAALLAKLDATRDSGRTLLDQSAVLLTSGVGAPGSPTELPVVIAGSCGGALETGKHVRFEGEAYARLLSALHGAVTGTSEPYGVDGATPLPILA